MRFPTAGFHFYTTIEFSWSDSTLCEKSKRKVFFFLAPSQVHTHAADFFTLIFYMGIQMKLIGISSSFLELKEENWLSNERRILCVCIQSKFLNVADPLRTKKLSALFISLSTWHHQSCVFAQISSRNS